MVLSDGKMSKPYWQLEYRQNCKAWYYPIGSHVRVSREVLHKIRYPVIKKKEVHSDYLVCTHPTSQSCGSAQLFQLDAQRYMDARHGCLLVLIICKIQRYICCWWNVHVLRITGLLAWCLHYIHIIWTRYDNKVN